MKDKYKALATYNAEVSRGIKHQDWWIRQMVGLQDEFNNDQRNDAIKKGYTIIENNSENPVHFTFRNGSVLIKY